MYTSTDDTHENNRFELTPTLATDQLSVNFSESLNSGSIIITNSHGVLESTKQIGRNTQNINIQTNQLPSGLYYLTVQSEKGLQTKKFMKI